MCGFFRCPLGVSEGIYRSEFCRIYLIYNGSPLIRTPEMCIQATSKSPKSMLFNTNSNSPLKRGHPSNKDTFTGPKGGRFRGFHFI